MITFLFALFVAFALAFYFRRPKKINLKGKLALISGGSAGLGQNICVELAKEGCNIAFCDISPPDETLEKLKNFDVKVKAYKTDVSSSKDIEKLRDDISSDFGCEVDILINNAGLIPYKTIFEQSYQEIEKLTAVNVNSIYFMTKCFLERMMSNPNGGHIVSISSLQGIYAFPHSMLYSSTKFAVTGFMLALKEFLRLQKLKNIHTTTILPHVINTSKGLVDKLNQNVVPLLQPNDVARTVVRAILYRRSFVTVPKFFGPLVAVFNCLPFPMQELIRDIQRENSFMS